MSIYQFHSDLGNDLYSGRPGRPFRSLDKFRSILAAAQPGDEIQIVRGSSYTVATQIDVTEYGATDNKITIRAVGKSSNAAPTFTGDGSSGLYLFNMDADDYVFDGLKLVPGSAANTHGILITRTRRSTFRRLEITGYGLATASNSGNAIDAGGVASYDNIMELCYIHDGIGDGITTGGSYNWIIRKNRYYDLTSDTNNISDGIALHYGTSGYCHIYDNDVRRIAGKAGISIGYGSKAYVYRNYVKDVDGTAGILCFEDEVNGLAAPGSYRAQCYAWSNVVEVHSTSTRYNGVGFCMGGFQVQFQADMYCWNNAVYNDNNAVETANFVCGDDGKIVEMYNNISFIASGNTTARHIKSFDISDAPYNLVSPYILPDFNLYYPDDTPSGNGRWNVASVAGGVETPTYFDWTTWRAAYVSLGLGSTAETFKVLEDPLFRLSHARPGCEYSPKEISPAFRQGKNLTSNFAAISQTPTDFLGRARPYAGSWSIGPFESQVPTSTGQTVTNSTQVTELSVTNASIGKKSGLHPA